MLYLKTVEPGGSRSRIQKRRIRDAPRIRARAKSTPSTRNRGLPPSFMAALPLFKPPYAHLVAIDLNEGAIAWRVPFGDMPALRKQLEALGVKAPEKLGAQGPPGRIVTKGGLIFIGGGDLAFHAVDKATGRDLWSAPLRETTGTPMTYQARSGRQFVVVATGRRGGGLAGGVRDWRAVGVCARGGALSAGALRRVRAGRRAGGRPRGDPSVCRRHRRGQGGLCEGLRGLPWGGRQRGHGDRAGALYSRAHGTDRNCPPGHRRDARDPARSNQRRGNIRNPRLPD